MNWEIKIISKILMIKISHISWGSYDKGFTIISVNLNIIITKNFVFKYSIICTYYCKYYLW